MSRLWKSLSLLFVLLHRFSADEGVKLICNKMVQVQVGDSVTLNCSINWTQNGQSCKGTEFYWSHADSDRHDGISCPSDNYTCEWDNLTYVSLTILIVSKEENYTVGMSSSCGMDTSPSITVKLKEMPQPRGTITKETKQEHVIAIVLGVLAAAIVVAVLCFLFKLYKRPKCQKPSNNEPGESSSPLNSQCSDT